MERFLDLSESSFLPTSYPLELNGEETQQVDGSWSQDEEPRGCGQLERRWVLWHEFMKEHAQLDNWLRFAEQAVSPPQPTLVTYVTAKEEMRKFERLRCETRSRLIQLDGLTQRNRTLTRLFQGAMQARLLASARECGQRWGDMNTKLESITGRLKLFVSEWEGFEAEREELALWLAELDVRLTEVDHFTGNTCEKLRQLQSFQQSVCVNSVRVNDLLERGEALIQRSEPTDAQRVESRLLELLRSCSLVYSNITRTHTRLLSMRLVFEDDWILSQATDSGCPSETLLEEEGAFNVTNLDLPAFPNHPKVSPTHEHLGLEWDPSVDIGRSVFHDDADSSYFSASTGLCHRDGVKRLGSLGSQTNSNDITNQQADLQMEGWLDHAHPSVPVPVVTQRGGTLPNGEHWATSTPDRQDGEPLCFDGGRVRAWLGVQGPASPERTTSCSKAVQTDVECYHSDAPNQLAPHLNNTQQPFPGAAPSPSHDLKASSDWVTHQYRSNLKAEEEQSRCEEAECLRSEQSVTSSSRPASCLLSPALLCLLLAAALALACLIWVVLEPPCHCSSRLPRSFHLALSFCFQFQSACRDLQQSEENQSIKVKRKSIY
ncbi:nesprin-2 isoform X1 [Anarrhichthys ocellatus]|uniref:nesprin-2 isoform X1 n=1 Tax=Anarrhichthys ocellatus TaxID=433405 RepID=UPI0012ED56D0|nr:nesprin-2-like isoform X1 [Anarrhichthys ocellatus]